MADENVSVLDRDMFRPKSRGLAGIDDTQTTDDLKARREQAMAMIEAAKQKFDPKNFQTLTEQERPQVFRPVAVNMPAPQQTADTAMRMQQMAAQGVRPVGMAEGGLYIEEGSRLKREGYSPYERSQMLAQLGLANHIYNSDLVRAPDYNVGEIQPTVSPDDTNSSLSPDEKYFDRLAKLRARMREIEEMPVRKSKPSILSTNIGEEVAKVGRTIADEEGKFTLDKLKERAREDKTPSSKEGNFAQVKLPQPYIQDVLDDKTRREQAAPDKRDYAGERDYIRRVSEDALAREQAAPDKRDYAGEREYAQRIAEDQAARQQGLPSILIDDKRDYAGERAYNKEQAGLAALEAAQRENAPDKRDYAGERAYREARDPDILAGRKAPISAGKGVASLAPNQAASPATTSPSPTQATQDQAKPTEEVGPMTMQGIRAERARQREENINLALIQAGLAIAGGKSSNALTNIGEGAQTGIRQFAEQEAESRKGMREDIRSLQEEQRASRALAEQRRQFDISSALSERQFAEGQRQFGVTMAFKTAQMDIADKQFEKTYGVTVQEALRRADQFEKQHGLAVTTALNNENNAAKEFVYKYQALKQAGDNAEADRLLKSRGLDIQEAQLYMLPDAAKTAAAVGGWDARSKTAPSADQIMRGLSLMKETDEMDTLEKIVRDPLTEEDLKKTATARLSAIISRRSSSGATSGGFQEGQTATGPNGKRIIYKNGQWVPLTP
jgi:hypothetical protein